MHWDQLLLQYCLFASVHVCWVVRIVVPAFAWCATDPHPIKRETTTTNIRMIVSLGLPHHKLIGRWF